MPVTRKSTRSRGGAASASSSSAASHGKHQQTLSFNHRVTKPTAKTGKDLLVEKESTPESITKKTKDVKIEDDEVVEVPASEAESEGEEEEEEGEEEAHAKAKAKVKTTKKPATQTKAAAKDLKKDTKAEVEEEKENKPKEPERSEVEKRALKLPQSAIDAYWHNIDSARMARAVHKKHTEGLTTGEKVLRYWDVSSHYGPCIGITRLKRWQRAERLGLNPPIEVLAVLLREEQNGNKAIEMAHMDELMNSVSTGP
ncbi:DNA polymerase delta, subunit 4-domain-containing protein [Sordaria brevicollis]|uniref:DNA polymerase delta, subunit 4-domain-containing protein n=1 Tax=Sordaria brevicollis TaxID=83679 RepID=A0AAE0P340_SORBR|nr:DNA polymerase delta, subunit 4-domain-containing protein [Sordaria brevicollis]